MTTARQLPDETRGAKCLGRWRWQKNKKGTFFILKFVPIYVYCLWQLELEISCVICI